MEQSPEREAGGCTCAGIVLDLIVMAILIAFPATSEPWITIRFIGIFILAPALLVVLYVHGKKEPHAQEASGFSS